MTDNTQEIDFQKLFQKLPKDVREAMGSVATSEAIENISKKYRLMINKMGRISEEVGYVMLGATHPRDFVSNLAKKLEIDQETARKIAEDINQQIFAKVRESLKQIHGVSTEGSSSGATDISRLAATQNTATPPLEPLQRISEIKTPLAYAQKPKAEPPKPLEIRPEGMTNNESATKTFFEKLREEKPMAKPNEQIQKPIPTLPEKEVPKPLDKAPFDATQIGQNKPTPPPSSFGKPPEMKPKEEIFKALINESFKKPEPPEPKPGLAKPVSEIKEISKPSTDINPSNSNPPTQQTNPENKPREPASSPIKSNDPYRESF